MKLYTVSFTRKNRTTGEESTSTRQSYAANFEDVCRELDLIHHDVTHVEETDVRDAPYPLPPNTYVMCYCSEGMNLEEDTWYAVTAADRVQAYGKLYDYIKKEDGRVEWSWADQTVEQFNESHAVMFEIKGPAVFDGSTILTVEEVK